MRPKTVNFVPKTRPKMGKCVPKTTNFVPKHVFFVPIFLASQIFDACVQLTADIRLTQTLIPPFITTDLTKHIIYETIVQLCEQIGKRFRAAT